MAELLTKQKRKVEGRTVAAKAKNPKGKKPFNKKGKRAPVQPVKRGEPVYLYFCECHGERAEKAPCERKAEDRAERKHSLCPLGTWRCSQTNRKCKVKRVKNAPVAEAVKEE